MKIIADAHIPYVEEYFGSYGELILKPGRRIVSADIKDADMLLVRSITQVNQALLNHSSIKFVGSVTAGADHLDIPWLNQSGIAWRVAEGFNAPPVADYVLCVIAALQQRNLLAKQRIKVAVIGVGNVGNLVVQHLQLLGIDVVQCDPLRAEQEKDFKSISLHDIHDVDLISVHVPLTKLGDHATHHFIAKDFLRRQRSGCILLNASRGAVVNSNELKQYGKHLFWCLDVWENEPNIDKAILERSLISTPHIAGYSVQSKIRGIDMIYKAACECGIISPKTMSPITMPVQQLSFTGANHSWQEIVLGVFNPIVLSAMMRTNILSADDVGGEFDEMRNQFHYRQELAYVEVTNAGVDAKGMECLKGVGVKFKANP
jgi:erythronate-4-phosphate dehydrogenase